MIVYNNQAPKNVNNVGQFGATEGSIGAYKSAAAYAADAKYWALLSQTRYGSVEDILAEVERLYAQGLLIEEDIIQLRSDFETQQQVLLGLIQSTNTAIVNTNAATELSKEATQAVLDQLDIISNMTVQTALLPPGSMATGSYDNSTGVFSFGIPEGKPGRDGTDGTISDIGSVPVGTPVSNDYGFYVDKDDGGLYRADMSDIANLVPSIRSISINGGEEQTGAVSFNSVSSFNTRTGDVVPQNGDYTAAQVGAFSVSNNLSEITNTSEAIKNIGLTSLGIATDNSPFITTGATFDWQSYDFKAGESIYIDTSVMVNTPAEMVYPSSITRLFITTEGARKNAAYELRVTPSTAANSNYKTYALRVTGSAGSRSFQVREELSSAIPVTIGQGGTGANNVADARTNLGLGLVSIESIVPLSKGGTGATNASAARTNLGLGSVSTLDNVPIANGGTGATTVDVARSNLSVDRVDQTSVDSKLFSPNKETYLFVDNDGWGCYSTSSGKVGDVALSVERGGTGATAASAARTNLGLGLVSTESIVPLSKGGTGATNAAGARLSLGLGNSATLNTGTSPGNVLKVGDFGIGRPDGAFVFETSSQDALLAGLDTYGLCVFRNNQQIAAPWDIWNYSSNLFFRAGDTYSMISIPFESAGKIKVFGGAAGQGWKTSRTVYDTVNTTVDSNGFIKAASPIVKIFHDGSFETNEQSVGVDVKKISTGVYLLSGCLGLNSDAGWGGVDGGFEIPIDRNKQPRVWLDYEVQEDGSLLVKTYHRTHLTSPAFARNELEGFSDGDPIDIPSDSFVSVRIEMPSE